MRWPRTDLVVSLLAAASAAAIGLLALSGKAGSGRHVRPASGATLRAKVVADPPPDATVVRASSALDDLPVARALVEWAARTDAREEWVGDVVEGTAGRRVVDALQGGLPHYRAPNRADADRDGVYVACEGRIVVLTAAGWSVTPELQ